MDKNGGGKQSNRVVVIGLDSADFYLVQRWADEGYLPTMSSLMACGSWGKLSSTADVSSGTVWPSFFTGTSPARHCGLGRRRLKLGTYRIVDMPYNASLVKKEPFWSFLNRSGKRVAIVDVPKTIPLKGLNGIQLVAWGAHSPSWYPDSWPPEAIKEVVSRFGKYPAPDDDEFIPSGYCQLKGFYEALVSGIKKKGLLSRYILNQEAWDLFLTVFAEPHCVGHNYWHLMDKKHPAYDSEMSRTLGNSILNVYSFIDSEIAKLVNTADIAFIVSPEGMGPNYTGSHLLPEILRRMDRVLKKKLLGRSVSRGSRNPLYKFMPSVLWGPHAIRNLKGKMPFGLIRAIELGKRILPKQVWSMWKVYLMSMGNDWQWSCAFCYPSDFNGAVRINLKGREPEGLVEPGTECDSLCEELAFELSRLINIDTGKRAVRDVLRVRSTYKGEYLDELPDIVVKWMGDVPIRGLYSPLIGTVTGENRHERSGAHRDYGFIIASGKHIVRGKALKGADIVDIAPTILYLMGRPVPRDMDGKVLLDIIEDEFKIKNPVCYE